MVSRVPILRPLVLPAGVILLSTAHMLAVAQHPALSAEPAEFWAFRSPHEHAVPVPSVRNASWPANEIDAFILQKLDEKHLSPTAPADKLTLIRRVTFDLLGLPPTPKDIQGFVNDNSPGAYETLIDTLMASPHYGERWGRHWLDVARYADSNGLDENIAHGNAWHYRNYVIDSLNEDKPYDRFILEQLAGDRIASDSLAEQRECQIATGFLSLGPKVLAEVDEAKMEMDIIDEQVETMGRAFMGLTLGCARCHDHKFDPISTEDYYALAGIFKSTKTMEHFTKIARWHEVSVASPEQQRQHAAHQLRINQMQHNIDQVIASERQRLGGESDETLFSPSVKAQLASLLNKLEELKAGAPTLPAAMSVVDSKKPMDLHVHVRGSHLHQSNVVPRGIPQALDSAGQGRQPLQEHSGRIELANWLIDGQHPLVARVMVNRVWRWHFGRGLVESTDNFGQLGDRPVNQLLLDWLAHWFVQSGWSIKSLHRQIMFSATYRMTSEHDSDNAIIDPENRFHWRFNVRRLEVESIRDAILAVSGLLDKKPRESLLHVRNREFLFDHTSKDNTSYQSHCRAVYLPVVRNHLYDMFQLFDYADASVTNSNRPTSTVPSQALFLMNSQLSTNAARAFAKRIISGPDQSDDQRLTTAYFLAFGRPVTIKERRRDRNFLTHIMASTQKQNATMDAWSALCQTLMMSSEFVYVR